VLFVREKNVWGRNVSRELNLEQIIMLNRIDLQFHTYACTVIKGVNRWNIIYVKSIHVNNRTHNFIDIITTILWTSRSGSDILLFYFVVVRQLRHALGWMGLETQDIFEMRGDGSRKSSFMRDVVYERPLALFGVDHQWRTSKNDIFISLSLLSFKNLTQNCHKSLVPLPDTPHI